MRRTVGVTTAEHVVVGVVEDRKVVGSLRVFPEGETSSDEFTGLPADALAQKISQEIQAALNGQQADAVGVAFPGIIRNGVIEDSPNLSQLKGCHMQDTLSAALAGNQHPGSGFPL